MDSNARSLSWTMCTVGACMLAGCLSGVDPESNEGLTEARQALTVSPPTSAFVVLARHGVTFADRATVSGGHVGVLASGNATPNSVTTGATARIAIGRELLAERVSLGSGSIAGNINANQINATGSTTGTQSPFVSPPVPPLPGTAAPGTTAVTVNSGQTRTLAAGAFGAVIVSGTLNLSGGTYNFRSLQVNNDGRVVALTSSLVRLATGVTGLDRSHVLVAAGLHADSLRLEASGSVDGNATGALFGNDAELTALVVAQGAFRAGDRLVASGAIAAQDVFVGFDARLTFDTGLGCSTNAQCDDGNACTVDSCVSGRCQNTQQNTCAAAITVGWDHTCVAEADGRVACWGANTAGQVGDGTLIDRLVPTFVPGVTDAIAVKGGNRQTCVLRASGGVLCWGENGFGELGDGTTVQRPSPVAVPLPRRAISVDINGGDSDHTAHACAVLDDHTVWCWGSNVWGALGDGTTTSRATPAPVTGVNTAVTVTAGWVASCALLASGSAVCWGTNDGGLLGAGDPNINTSTVPIAVAGVTNIAVIDAGFNGLLLTTTRSAFGWGQGVPGVGGVGDGATIDRFAPVPVLNAADVVAIGAGLAHSCIVHATGTASCWGSNFSGELGDGTTVNATAPVNVVGLTGVRTIAAGRMHSCAVKSDGSVWCWGQSFRGGLGDGTLTDHLTPVRSLL